MDAWIPGSISEKFKLVILSNVDVDSFNQTLKNHLNVDFYRIYTAEEIKSYKPDIRNFQYMLEKLSHEGYEMDEIMHVAQSMYHDIVPAKSIGMKTIWINHRAGKQASGATPEPPYAVS